MPSLTTNRTVKALALAAAIREHLPAVETSVEIARSIEHQAPEFWALVASVAGTKPPSVETIQVVAAILLDTAEHPDPFDGF